MQSSKAIEPKSDRCIVFKKAEVNWATAIKISDSYQYSTFEFFMILHACLLLHESSVI